MKFVPVFLLIPLALAACASQRPVPHSYGNDALPSAEVIAFEKANARLNYTGARIDYDADNCAVYEGTAPDGQMKREPLLDASNKRICVKR